MKNNEIIERYMEGEDETRSLSFLSREGVLNLPAFSNIRNIVTSGDVIHRWALPSLCLKVDAIPGRLNILNFNLSSEGRTLYGQCSELCGVNHRFIPIIIQTQS